MSTGHLFTVTAKYKQTTHHIILITQTQMHYKQTTRHAQINSHKLVASHNSTHVYSLPSLHKTSIY